MQETIGNEVMAVVWPAQKIIVSEHFVFSFSFYCLNSLPDSMSYLLQSGFSAISNSIYMKITNWKSNYLFKLTKTKSLIETVDRNLCSLQKYMYNIVALCTCLLYHVAMMKRINITNYNIDSRFISPHKTDYYYFTFEATYSSELFHSVLYIFLSYNNDPHLEMYFGSSQ